MVEESSIFERIFWAHGKIARAGGLVQGHAVTTGCALHFRCAWKSMLRQLGSIHLENILLEGHIFSSTFPPTQHEDWTLDLSSQP